MMWVDGHLLLAGLLCWPVAWLLIAAANARMVRRLQARQDVTARSDR